MKKLVNVVLHGSRQGKATGWQFWPGFAVAHFDNGTQKYCGDVSVREVIEKVRGESGVGEYEARLQRWIETGVPQ